MTSNVINPFIFINQPQLQSNMMMYNYGFIYELWKPIQLIYPEFTNEYWVSNFGRVYSVCSNKFIHGGVNSRGYNTINLRLNNTSKSFTIHRLVAMLFIPNINKYPIINHKDGNRLNNFYLNLEWCTQGHNVQHAYDTKLRPVVQGENWHNSKYTNEQVHQICKALEDGKSNKYICKNILNVEYNEKNTVIIRRIKSKNGWVCISNQYNINKKKNNQQNLTDDELRKIYCYIKESYTNKQIMDNILGLSYEDKSKRGYYRCVLNNLRNGTGYKHIIA